MALFSQRFWIRLGTLDARVVTAQRRQRTASERMLIAQRLVTGAGLEDFSRELRASTSVARNAVCELSHFCTGRSRAQPRSTLRIDLDELLTDSHSGTGESAPAL